MLFFFSSLVAVFASLVSPNLGSIIFGVCGVVFLLKKNESALERALSFLLFTLPVSMIPVVEDIPPLFSWASVGLVVSTLLLVKHRNPVSLFRTYIFFLYILASTITITLSFGGVLEVYYTIQVLLFFLPILFAIQASEALSDLFSKKTGDRLLIRLSAVLMTLNLSVLVQWQTYIRLGVKIGEVDFFGSRITYDSLVPAYSVLSSILAIGLPLGPILWNRGQKNLGLILPVFSVAAIVINSSRTGLVAGFLGLMLLFLFSPSASIKFSTKISVLAFFFAAVVVNASLSFLSNFRGGNFFADNGRFDTFEDGLRLIGSSVFRFLFGVGYADYPTTPPHNFVIESLVCSGLVATVIFCIWLASMFLRLRRSEWLYLPLTILIGGQLYSGFYNVKAFTIVSIVAIAIYRSSLRSEGSERQGVSSVENHGIATRSVPINNRLCSSDETFIELPPQGYLERP